MVDSLGEWSIGAFALEQERVKPKSRVRKFDN
jgi:hypothetical protein